MTLNECYEKLHGNYEDAKSRLMNDRLVEKFLLKFPADPTMDQLREAVKEEKIEESFRAAHTLKGVAANMAFTDLQKAASDLTEQLRDRTQTADPALLQVVEENYKLVRDVIEEYKALQAK